jgi:hypothetical protein
LKTTNWLAATAPSNLAIDARRWRYFPEPVRAAQARVAEREQKPEEDPPACCTGSQSYSEAEPIFPVGRANLSLLSSSALSIAAWPELAVSGSVQLDLGRQGVKAIREWSPAAGS